jgi:hypothetical protein
VGDAPEISRSRGQEGGIVVLWPRISPRTEDPATLALARSVQLHAAEIAQRVAPGAPIDLRPAPERVCPRAGCLAPQIGLVFSQRGGGCAVIATLSPAGTQPAQLVPWAGAVELTATSVPFREPPESLVRVRDMAPCGELVEIMRASDASVEQALRGLLPPTSD